MINLVTNLANRVRGSNRIRTPTVLQMEAVECAAASLSMILGHYGRFVPLTELRQACGVSRDGSKASNILKAARGYGLKASGSKKSLRALRNSTFPCIIFWNFNHYVVLEGFHERKRIAYLNDPAQGPRKVNLNEFDESFTGVVLELSPGPNFKKGGKSIRIADALQARLTGSKSAIAYVCMVSLLMAIMGILVPAFSKIYVDEYLVGRNYDLLRPLLLVMCGTAALQACLVWLQQHYLLRLETKLAVAGSSDFFWHVLRLPLSFYTQRFAGDIGSRVRLANNFANLLSRDLAGGVLSLINVAFFASVMFLYDVPLTLIGLFFCGLSFAAVALTSHLRIDANKRLQTEEGKSIGVAMGGVQIMESLKASGCEADFFSRWSGQQVKATNARQTVGLSVNLLSVLGPFLAVVSSAAILGFGSIRVMNGEMSMGMLVAFQALMIGLSEPVNRLVQLSGKVQDATGDLYRLNDVLQNPIDDQLGRQMDPASNQLADSPLTGELEIRNLTFGYSPLDPPLIDDFSLRMSPGRRVALVGGSGSGKSTIAKVVAGACPPWKGEILFDGRPRDACSRQSISNGLAMVDQNISVFSGTIRDNLTMWDKTIDDARLVESAKDALIHEAVAARPGGYDSELAEGGANFSGGQLQRLEIARALVSRPSILILDEATSALDPTTEKQVDENIRRRGCTCLIVAHRLSTIRDCDEIIVLERGKVVERGTHEQLVANQANYFKLIQAA